MASCTGVKCRSRKLLILLKEQLIGSLDSAKLKVQVKQAQMSTMQEALAKALEFESCVRSNPGRWATFRILNKEETST